MTIRRALVAATTAALLAVPMPAAASDPIDDTREELAEDAPIVECRVTFLIGPVMCRVERTWNEVLDPGDE